MIDFGVDIKIEGSTAEQAIKRVSTELDRNERAAKAAKDAVKQWADAGAIAADKEADAVRRLTREFANSERATDKAAEKASVLAQSLARIQVGQGFAGISQHFERMSGLVEQIHAPMREHIADVAALSTAYQSGLISAKEYTNEMVRMRTAQQPGVGSGIASGLGLGVLQGGAAGVAAMATGKALELGHDLLGLGESYTSLGNRIDQVSKSEAEHARLMDKTREVANDARAEWNATGELFVRLTNATKDLNLSQGHTLRLTETISKAFAQSGATGAEASGAMLQLSQAFAMGSLHGQEFNSVNAAAPFLLDIFAQKLGVNRSALKHMAEEGKITSQVMIAAFDDAATAVDASFARSTPTFSQSMAVIKNKMEATFGPLLNELMPKLGAYLTGIADRITGIVDVIERAASQLDKIPGGRSAVGKAYDAGRLMFDPTEQIGAVADYYDRNAAELTHAQVDPAIWGEYVSQFQTLEEQVAATVKEFTQVQAPTETWNQQLDHLLETTHDLPAHVERSERAWANTFKVLDGGINIIGQITSKFDETLLAFTGVDDLILPGLDAWLGKVTDLNNAHTTLATGATTAIGRYSVMLGNMVTNWAASLAALKAWDDTLVKSTGTHKKHADSWATSFVSPTLVQIDLLIMKMKEFLAVENAAMRVPGLRDLGVSQKGLAGGLPSSADATVWMANIDEAKFTRDQQAAWERAQKEQAFRQQLYGGYSNLYGTDGSRTGYGDHDPNKGFFHAENKEQEIAYTKRWTEELEKNKKEWEDVDKFGQQALGHIEDSLVQLATTGKASFHDLVTSIEHDLARLASHELLMSIVHALKGDDSSAIGAITKKVPHAASGWSGTIGGSSYSGDKVPFMAMVNSGEHVQITPRWQAPSMDYGGGRGGGSMPVVQNHNSVAVHMDPRALTKMLRSPGARREILQIVLSERDLLRSAR